MGGGGSKPENTGSSTTSTGSATNNVHINDKVDVASIEILILLGIICAIKVFELISFIYRKHYRDIKKRLVQSA